MIERAEEMVAPGDRTFVIRLQRPFGLVLEAFSNSCFVMPERVARTDAFTQIGEYAAPAHARTCGRSVQAHRDAKGPNDPARFPATRRANALSIGVQPGFIRTIGDAATLRSTGASIAG